jgi:SAM-dependent methyltransferase
MIDPALPHALEAIVRRFARTGDPLTLALFEQFARWQRGEAGEHFEREWAGVVERALTRPHWVSFLFPGLCTSNPDLLPFVQKLSCPLFSPPAVRAEIETARAGWLDEQGDLANADGMIVRLLSELAGASPNEGGAFVFLSRYYAFTDLLAGAFVDPSWQPLHEKVFSILFLQRRNWPNGYCNDYLYQGWHRLGLCGIKPTGIRLAGYGIDSLLAPTSRVLDVGANSGCLALALAERVAQVDAIELNPFMVEIARISAAHLAVTNVRFSITDIATWTPEGTYDAVFSLANHCTIDGRMSMDFETYMAKLFALLKPGGWLFFESHNVFGPGSGAPGDDGDLEQKFDTAERYFELVSSHMTRAFVPTHDIDKLFIQLRRRETVLPQVLRRLDLNRARLNFSRDHSGTQHWGV